MADVSPGVLPSVMTVTPSIQGRATGASAPVSKLVDEAFIDCSEGEEEEEQATRQVSMADLAVKSSLSPLDALYQQTRAQRKAAAVPLAAAIPPASTTTNNAKTKGVDGSYASATTQHVYKEPVADMNDENVPHGSLETTAVAQSKTSGPPRESVMSNLTVGSANGNPFHYEAYAGATADELDADAIEQVDPYLSRIPSVVHPRAYVANLSPKVNGGSPASVHDERFQDYDTPSSSKAASPALSQGSFVSLDPSSAGPSYSSRGVRNFSRPTSATTRSIRSSSNASSLAGGQASSIGHSSSSHAVSLSSSWDHRYHFELQRQDAMVADFHSSRNAPADSARPSTFQAEIAPSFDRYNAAAAAEQQPHPAVAAESTPSKKWSWFKRKSHERAADVRFSAASTVKASDLPSQGPSSDRSYPPQQLAPPAPRFAGSDRPPSGVSSATRSAYSDRNSYRDSRSSFGQNGGTPAAVTMLKAKESLRKAHFASDVTTGGLDLDNPATPQEYLQAGIIEHESGDLHKAAWLFSKSAQGQPPCAGGMLMYGLTLRHGWGCAVSAEEGFAYIQSAAELISQDLDRAVSGGRVDPNARLDARAVRNELVLALHEIGTSLRFGWGVKKDKRAAVEYFKLAADMGDVDAQQDLAFCYANGKGCKKSMKMAAKYYRLAIGQGAPSFGLSWVFKPKFDDE